MAAHGKIPITDRALIQRVNRTLADRQQVLKRARGRVKAELGEFFVVDLRHNVVSAKRVNISKLAEELGALQAYERLDRTGSGSTIKPAKTSSKGAGRRSR